MDPDELKIQKRKSAITKWQQYVEQVEKTKKAPVCVSHGPLSGKMVEKLDVNNLSELTTLQESEKNSKSQQRDKIAIKINDKSRKTF